MDNFGIAQQYPAWTTEDFGEVHFADFYMVKLANDPRCTVDYLGRISLSYMPFFVRILLKIRDLLVFPFGLKTGDAHSLPALLYFEKGSVLVYFHVLKRSEEIIVLEEKDKHLNFRVLLRVDKDEIAGEICFRMSTIIHFNNIWGQLYFMPVKPFHQIIMRAAFKKLLKQVHHEKQ